MAERWTWSEDGEPSMDILPGFEITPMRLSDMESWVRMFPGWEGLSPEEQAERREKWKTTFPRRVESTKPFVEAFRQGQPVLDTPMWYARDKTNGLGVCRINFNPLDETDPPGTRNMGWSTLAEYRRKGIAKAALKALLENWMPWLQEIHTLTANCREDNYASLAVLRATGFEKVSETSADSYADRPELSGAGMIVYNFEKHVRKAAA